MMTSTFLNVEFKHMLQRCSNDVFPFTLQLCRVFIINIITVNVNYLCLPYSELLEPSQPLYWSQVHFPANHHAMLYFKAFKD